MRMASGEPEARRATGEFGMMERAANALLGAASGGILGLLISGLVGMILRTEQGSPMALTAGVTVLLAVLMAAGNARQKQVLPPVVPRAVWGVLLTSVALLITLAVFLFQSAYIQSVTSAGARVQLPLPIWPVSRIALLVSLCSILLGLVSAVAGWAELAAKLGEYTGGKWVAMSVLVAGAWAGLALICYVMGYGFTFLG